MLTSGAVRLLLEPAASWRVERAGDRLRFYIDGAAGIRIDVSALEPLPEVATAWGQSVLRGDLPPSTVLNIILATDLKTEDGWKLSLVESQALSAATMEVVESRIHVFYTLMFHCAVVVVRTTSAAEMDAHRAEIVDAIGKARPDWSGEIVALGQILAPPAPPARTKP